MAVRRSAGWTLFRALALVAIFGMLLQAAAGPSPNSNGAGRCNDNGQGKKLGHRDCGAPPPLSCPDQCTANYNGCLAGAGGDPDLEAVCQAQYSSCIAACP